jgi:hypothetical protein
LTKIAERIASMNKISKNRPRVAIVTQGPKPVIVAICHPDSTEVSISEYEVEELS